MAEQLLHVGHVGACPEVRRRDAVPQIIQPHARQDHAARLRLRGARPREAAPDQILVIRAPELQPRELAPGRDAGRIERHGPEPPAALTSRHVADGALEVDVLGPHLAELGIAAHAGPEQDERPGPLGGVAHAGDRREQEVEIARARLGRWFLERRHGIHGVGRSRPIKDRVQVQQGRPAVVHGRGRERLRADEVPLRPRLEDQAWADGPPLMELRTNHRRRQHGPIEVAEGVPPGVQVAPAPGQRRHRGDELEVPFDVGRERAADRDRLPLLARRDALILAPRLHRGELRSTWKALRAAPAGALADAHEGAEAVRRLIDAGRDLLVHQTNMSPQSQRDAVSELMSPQRGH